MEDCRRFAAAKTRTETVWENLTSGADRSHRFNQDQMLEEFEQLASA